MSFRLVKGLIIVCEGSFSVHGGGKQLRDLAQSLQVREGVCWPAGSMRRGDVRLTGFSVLEEVEVLLR